MSQGTFAKLKMKERKLRKQVIVDTVQYLVSEKNLFNITLKDISDDIGITPTSIYRFFKSKDDIFYYIVLKDIEQLDLLIEKHRSEITSVEDFIDATAEYLIQYQSVSNILWYFFIGMDSDPSMLDYFNVIEKKILEIFNKIFAEMGAADIDHIKAQTLLYSLMGLIVFFRKSGGMDKKQIKQVLSPIAESIVSGSAELKIAD